MPDEVEEAGAEELEEPWEARLREFVSKRMSPTDVASHANTASEVREHFFSGAAAAAAGGPFFRAPGPFFM